VTFAPQRNRPRWSGRIWQGIELVRATWVAPQDQNFIGFYFDIGLTYKGLFPSRHDDTIGIAFDYARLSSGAQQAAIVSGSVGVGAEMVLEDTYQARITKWLSMQPDLQFSINPGGNRDLKNALATGLRTAITF
jgi:porin